MTDRDSAYETDVEQNKDAARARQYCASCLRRDGHICKITRKTIVESVHDCKRAGWRDLGHADPDALRVELRYLAERIYKPTQDTDPEDDK